MDSEQEKLNATKAYIDMQIQNNRLREEMESTKFELTNKVNNNCETLPSYLTNLLILRLER